jgi:xanthine phosphoribosyltransferase
MNLLQDRILEEGIVISDNILKVDSFLNHQIDPALMDELGKEIANRFRDMQPTKVLTLESSGIAVALMAGLHLKVPVLFAKKKKPSTMKEASYSAHVHSFTKNITTDVIVSAKYLTQTDRILIVDDFLANGDAATALADIIKQSQATLLGVSVAIEKGFQPGRKLLEEKNILVHSLVSIKSLVGGKVTFV